MSKRLRFCPAALISVSQFTHKMRRKRKRRMPIFAHSEQQLNLHATLAHGFLIRLVRMIDADLLEVLLIEAAFEHASMLTGGAMRLEGTRVTGCLVGQVAFLPLILGMGMQRQDGIVGTDVDILLMIVAERLLAIDRGSFVKIEQRYIGSHVLIFYRHNIFDDAARSSRACVCTVSCVAEHPFMRGMNTPRKDVPPLAPVRQEGTIRFLL